MLTERDHLVEPDTVTEEEGEPEYVYQAEEDLDTLPVTESVATEVDVFVTEGDELIVVLTEPVFVTLVVPVPLLVPVELRDDVVLRVTLVLAVDVPHMVVDTLELVDPDFSVLADILVDDDDEKDGALVNELAGEEDSSAETEPDPLAE